MIKAVLIDIDNTLLSFSGYVKEAMREGFAKFGLKPYTEDMFDTFERINNGLWRRLEQGTLTFEVLQKIRWNLIFAELGIEYDGEAFETYFREKLFTSAVPEPNAHELLRYLASKYTVCAASNGPFEQQLNRLRIGGMYDCFSHIFISSAIGAQKPSAEFFDHCFRVLRNTNLPDLKPEEAMIIGDSMSSDIAGGTAYGLRTCLYRSGKIDDETRKKVDHAVHDLKEIMEIL